MRRGAPFEKKRAIERGIEMDDEALEDLSSIETNIYIYIRVVSEVANAIGSLIDRGCIPRIIPAACPPLFRSFYRLSSKLLETFAGFFERYRR